jgi:hypothetical protein
MGGFVAVVMQRRAPYVSVLQIDAKLINARQKLPVVNQLETMVDAEIICISMSSAARNEVLAGFNSIRTLK